MKNIIKSNYKYIIIFTIALIFIIILLCSYKGLIFFHEGFNELDYLMFNIFGDGIIVGIVTYFSTKSISIQISKNEFNRYNKINVTINKSRNKIISYESFMNIYENDKCFFGVTEDKKEIIDYIYELYDFLLKTLRCDGVEKQLLETILNIPFCIKYFDDNNIENSYYEIIKDFDEEKRFNNISILKDLINEEDIKKLVSFSEIMLNIKHYKITNLSNNESCQLLVTANNVVSCKIPCLQSNTYELYLYYDKECWIDCIAFSFDYNSKEYAHNLMGFKYLNKEIEFKPAYINLDKYINFK